MGSGGEIINLNVGGQRFSTSRHTLTAIPVSPTPFILNNKNCLRGFGSVAYPEPGSGSGSFSTSRGVPRILPGGMHIFG
jgi:hypothetical protein